MYVLHHGIENIGMTEMAFEISEFDRDTAKSKKLSIILCKATGNCLGKQRSQESHKKHVKKCGPYWLYSSDI